MPQLELIHGDRRADRRYAFEMPFRYSYRDGSGTHTGAGCTQDLSGGGIRFITGSALTPGAEIELRVNWPFLLQNVCPMELLVWGKVVRSGSFGTVVSMAKHEFRTCGTRSFGQGDSRSETCNMVG